MTQGPAAAIQRMPHWRVNFRPMDFSPTRIPSVSSCIEIIEKTRVQLRGWDYPHLSTRTKERQIGSTWVAFSSDFIGHKEYWRLYQSGQFIHLFAIREAAEPSWRDKLEAATRSHLRHLPNIDVGAIPGFVSIVNFLYHMTEIYEFAARLGQNALYEGALTITVELKNIRGFVLTTDWDRAWFDHYSATENELHRTDTLPVDLLIGRSAEKSLEAVVWFFERFGWLNPPLDVLRSDQATFLRGRG